MIDRPPSRRRRLGTPRNRLILAVLVAGFCVLALTARSRHSDAGGHTAAVARGGQVSVGQVGLDLSHDLYAAPPREIRRELSQIDAGGVSWVREDLPWASAEPSRGVFSWGSLDRLMTAASLTRVNVLGILDYSAPWASSDPNRRGNVLYPPKHNGDFVAYAAAVVARYGSRGSFWREHPGLTARPLRALEIWNEPYGSWFWKSGPDPRAYAQLVRRTAPAIHAADPQMKVLMSGDLYSSEPGGAGFRPWLAPLLANSPDVPRLVDALDVHPYPEPRNLGPYDAGPELGQAFGRVALIRRTELAAGVRLPIWITEIGWHTTPATPQSVSDQTQARFLADAVRRAVVEWGSYVPRIFLFAWSRSNGVRGDSQHNYGLLDPAGMPKPAWVTLTRMLGGSPGVADPGASLST